MKKKKKRTEKVRMSPFTVKRLFWWNFRYICVLNWELSHSVKCTSCTSQDWGRGWTQRAKFKRSLKSTAWQPAVADSKIYTCQQRTGRAKASKHARFLKNTTAHLSHVLRFFLRQVLRYKYSLFLQINSALSCFSWISWHVWFIFCFSMFFSLL